LAKVLILSIPEEEESLIDKIMAIINNPHDGQEISLTGTEFKMLYYLASNKGMALSKDQIYNFIWNGEYALDDSNITSHIRRLRVKIEDDPAQPQYIQTVWGIGYRMRK